MLKGTVGILDDRNRNAYKELGGHIYTNSNKQEVKKVRNQIKNDTKNILQKLKTIIIEFSAAENQQRKESSILKLKELKSKLNLSILSNGMKGFSEGLNKLKAEIEQHQPKSESIMREVKSIENKLDKKV